MTNSLENTALESSPSFLKYDRELILWIILSLWEGERGGVGCSTNRWHKLSTTWRAWMKNINYVRTPWLLVGESSSGGDGGSCFMDGLRLAQQVWASHFWELHIRRQLSSSIEPTLECLSDCTKRQTVYKRKNGKKKGNIPTNSFPSLSPLHTVLRQDTVKMQRICQATLKCELKQSAIKFGKKSLK